MIYIHDQTRRELLYPLMLIQITYLGALDTDKTNCIKICADALDEILQGCDDKKQRQLLRSVSNAISVTLRDYVHKAPEDLAGEKVVLATYCLLDILSNAGRVNIITESPLASLTEHMLSGININDALTQKRLKNANKNALRWLNNLREIGFYV